MTTGSGAVFSILSLISMFNARHMRSNSTSSTPTFSAASERDSVSDNALIIELDAIFFRTSISMVDRSSDCGLPYRNKMKIRSVDTKVTIRSNVLFFIVSFG